MDKRLESFIKNTFDAIRQQYPKLDIYSSRVEAKNPALLSSRDGYLLELTGWTQGSQAS